MRISKHSAQVAAGALLALAATASASVRIERVAYHGWPGCYRMSNRTVDLVYVPQVGRIMRFAMLGQKDVLWENPRLAGRTSESAKPGEWANYGGDKLWPSPQSVWNWPPDPALDGSPVEVRIAGSALEIIGQRSNNSGIRFTRRIDMSPSGATVDLVDTMTNTSRAPVTFGVWEIAQTDNPARALLPLEVSKAAPNGWLPMSDEPASHGFVDAQDGMLLVKRNPKAGFKVGSTSNRGFIRAEVGKYEFTMHARRTHGTYPDSGLWLMVYAGGDPNTYTEIEITGPVVTLKPGQATSLHVTWEITKQ